MSSENVITFDRVFKKYSKQQMFHKSLREELMSALFFRRRHPEELGRDEFWALQDISFGIRKGECVGLQGPNGSGKSTILKLISRVTYPSSGVISVRSRVAPLIELGAGFHPDLSGAENIFMNGTILGLSIRELQRQSPEIIAFAGLEEFVHIPVKKYSSGMALRLAFSIAIHSPAETFLFDEVLSVGDEEFQERCNVKIDELKRGGKTIVVVSHDRKALDRVCDKKIQLNHGVLVAEVLSGEGAPGGR